MKTSIRTEKYFRQNDQVVNFVGEVLTVREQTNDSQVFVYEESNNWYHPTELILLYRKEQ
mgnify:CR=1 FL=1